jgi:hypothetical protein
MKSQAADISKVLPDLPIKRKTLVRTILWSVLLGGPGLAAYVLVFLRDDPDCEMIAFSLLAAEMGMYLLLRATLGRFDSYNVSAQNVTFVPLTGSGLHVDEGQRKTVNILDYRAVVITNSDGVTLTIRLEHPDKKYNVMLAVITNMILKAVPALNDDVIVAYAKKLAAVFNLPLDTSAAPKKIQALAG